MTDRPDLDAIEAEANAATEGPWLSEWDKPYAPADPLADGETMIMRPDGSMIVGIIYYDGEHVACKREDAALIASSRTNVPMLCAYARRLEARVKELESAMHDDGK